MNLLKDTSIIAVGTTLVGAGLLITTAGRGIPVFATYAAITTLLLTVVAITVNTYRNARPDRPMGRLLHDPDQPGDAPRTMAPTTSRTGAQ